MRVCGKKAVVVGLAAVGVLAAVLLGVRVLAPPPPAPVRVVERVLEMRRSRVRDARAYAPYFASDDLAEELVRAAEEETSTPIPSWRTPYIAAFRQDEADVVVVWCSGETVRTFARASLFVLRHTEGRWLIVDARTYQAGEAVPRPAASRSVRR